MATSVFPLNILEKEDAPERLQKLLGIDPKYWVSADELNKIVGGLNEHQLSLGDLKVALEAYIQTGAKTVQTYADLPDPTTQIEGTPYKVANDVDASKNGFYAVTNDAWVKDSNLVASEVDIDNTFQGTSGKAVIDFSIERESSWFIKQTGVSYLQREVDMLPGILYFYASNQEYTLFSFAKGESVVNQRIGVRRTSDESTFDIITNNNDVGIHTYQTFINDDIIIITVNWDVIPDLSTYYVSTSTRRFVATQKIIEPYFSNAILSHFNTSNITSPGAYLNFRENSIFTRSAFQSLIEINSDTITDKERKIEAKFYVDDLMENGCLIGFLTTTSERILFGFEPAYSAIVFYIEGIAFRTLITSEEFNTDTFIDIKIEIINNDVVASALGKSFKVSDYTSAVDVNNINRIRLNIKAYNSDFYLKDILFSEAQNPKSIYEKIGDGVYVYKTGLANGDPNYNDWSFVRTPVNYNPNRKKPYPFVICNHGNGWTMDGTINKANYTQITQWGVDDQNGGAYLNTSAPYYKEYSSETIERLLEAGYVVCGTMNYAAAEYGSDRGRNALQDYFYHMRKNWNVEDKCFMIGASNGGMMSLNGAYLLGIENIKAIVLQYPLVCLFRHYKGYAGHQAAIESLYGLTGTETDAQLHAAFNDHDPEYANTVEISGLRYKTKLFPPLKIWHSPDDTVVSNINNSIPLIELVERSHGKVEHVLASGQHGDYTHVDPVAILDFFNKYL